MAENPEEILTFLSGGTGTPKLLLGIRGLVPDDRLIVIGNTGDDDEFYGLLVSPDVDTLLYLFSEELDLAKFWGVKNESFNCLNQLKEKMQEDTWFHLGDKDLALHLTRNKLMTKGHKLSQIVKEISKSMGIKAKIIPMSDDPARTIITTETGEELPFQEYWVKRKGEVPVKRVRYQGIEKAKGTKEAIEAIKQAKAVIIGPSNPIASIGPILALKEIQKALEKTKAKIIAISPLKSGKAFSGSAVELMKTMKLETSVVGVAKSYQKFLDTIIIDEEDKSLTSGITALGIKVITTNISLQTKEERRNLAKIVLKEAGVEFEA